MSSLKEACDALLAQTGILAHQYGIPLFPTAQLGLESDLQGLEDAYHELHNELTQKLEKLLFLNALKELQGQSEVSIDDKYDVLVAETAFKGDPDQLEAYYKQQLAFKSGLLNNYLTPALPILRSVHHNDANLTETELAVLENLRVLFSGNDKYALGDANINRLVAVYGANNEEMDASLDLQVLLGTLLETEVQPKLQQLHESNTLLRNAKDDLTAEKTRQIANLAAAERSRKKVVKQKMAQLANRWAYVSVVAEFLPSLIMSSPMNWYNDKALFSIVGECEDLAERLQREQSRLNVRDMANWTFEDMLMVDWAEVE